MAKDKKEQFNPHDEALKILQEEDERLDKMIQINAETTDIIGTRICVNFSDGRRRAFFYVERGLFEGWNED